MTDDLRLLAVAPRAKLEHGLLADDLLQHALADVEHHVRVVARADADERAGFVLADLSGGAGRRIHRRGIVGRKHAHPASQFGRAAEIAGLSGHGFRRHGSKSSTSESCCGGGTSSVDGSLSRPRSRRTIRRPRAGAEQCHDDKDRGPGATPDAWCAARRGRERQSPSSARAGRSVGGGIRCPRPVRLRQRFGFDVHVDVRHGFLPAAGIDRRRFHGRSVCQLVCRFQRNIRHFVRLNRQGKGRRQIFGFDVGDLGLQVLPPLDRHLDRQLRLRLGRAFKRGKTERYTFSRKARSSAFPFSSALRIAFSTGSNDDFPPMRLWRRRWLALAGQSGNVWSAQCPVFWSYASDNGPAGGRTLERRIDQFLHVRGPPEGRVAVHARTATRRQSAWRCGGPAG